MKDVIVLFGKPGAGKGTRLSEFLEGRSDQFEVLSVGNLLRKARAEQTELGKKASAYMDAGQLVPDNIINAIAIEGIKNAEKPIFTDGFPRTVAQAKAMLAAGVYPSIVVEFWVEDELVVERSRNRIVCPSCGEPYTLGDFKPPKVKGICDKCNNALVTRADDAEAVVRRRLEVYQDETYPVLQVFVSAGIPVFTINNSDAETAQTRFAVLMDSCNL